MAKKEDEVLAINNDFYKAFESLNVKGMEKVWARENYIQCFHPGWELIRGWEPVMASWRQIFDNTEVIRFELSETRLEVRDSMAWVTQYENISSRLEGEGVRAVVLSTNIFEKRPEGWRMIHHHGSTVVHSLVEPSSSTVH